MKQPDFTSELVCISFRFLSKAIVWVLFAASLPAFAQEDYSATDLQLRGLLGDKLKIEMHLATSEGEGFHASATKECFSVSGSYYYRSQIKPISLSGRFCLANYTFFLEDQPGAGTTERFEGKWDPKTHQLAGTWTLKSNGKTMPFTLSPIEQGVATGDLQKFFDYLNQTLSGEAIGEGAGIESANWSASGGKITGFSPSWSGFIAFLSPMRFHYYTSYNSTARASNYYALYQLLPSANGPYLVILEGSSNYDKVYDDQPDMEADGERCDARLMIMQYRDEEWEEVTDQLLPLGSKTSMDANSTICETMILSDAILLPGGAKVYWDGSKFASK